MFCGVEGCVTLIGVQLAAGYVLDIVIYFVFAMAAGLSGITVAPAY